MGIELNAIIFNRDQMHHFHHYSFDLWLTLIRSNPQFKTERTRIFHSDFNPAQKSIEEVALAFRFTDLMCNAINERTGKNIDADEMYLMVISQINDNKVNLQALDLDKLLRDMDDLLFCHPPILYCSETVRVLDHLKAKAGATLNILSNTGFIKGNILRKVLTQLGIHQYFDFQIYSDEVGLSKPNSGLFNLLLTSARNANKEKDIHLTDIMHVGDNPITGIAGARAAGMNSMLVNSNNVCISNILN